MKYPILFACTGFSSTSVFILKDGRQLHIGGIFNRGIGPRPLEFSTYCESHGVESSDIPSEEEVLNAYKAKLEEKGVWINDEIRYAG